MFFRKYVFGVFFLFFLLGCSAQKDNSGLSAETTLKNLDYFNCGTLNKNVDVLNNLDDNVKVNRCFADNFYSCKKTKVFDGSTNITIEGMSTKGCVAELRFGEISNTSYYMANFSKKYLRCAFPDFILKKPFDDAQKNLSVTLVSLNILGRMYYKDLNSYVELDCEGTAPTFLK